MTINYQKLYEFLEKSKSYPHQPESVNHVQTHISHVFIAPPFVYKIKKPVDFGFLDYSTLKKRKYFCEQEVELNRRLCSEIYIGVVAITKSEHGFELEPDSAVEADIAEYAVKMKLLEQKYFLRSYINNDTLTNRHLDLVSDKLTDFYLKQSPGDYITLYGRIDKIRFNTDENFQQTEAFIGNTIERDEYEAIKYFTNQYFEMNASLFQKRIEEKRIVDGHGDLHLEHIHVSPGGICIYDCIEFSERLRCGDQAADLAFLAMDLDFYGRRNESRYFIEQMARKLNDPDLKAIIDFYKCYRAYVKGKVKSLQSAEDEVDAAERTKAAEKASFYFQLALRYALLGSQPVVLICMGRVGTGKSTLAGHLSRALGKDSFSSDRVRKQLAGIPLYERPGPEKRKELYSLEMSGRTYRILMEKANEEIKKGRSVILDATYSLRSGRLELADELKATGADYIFIEARAPDETVLSRLKSREGKNESVSDARPEDFEMLDARYQPPTEIGSDHRIEVNTGTPLPQTIRRLYRELVDRRFRHSSDV